MNKLFVNVSELLNKTSETGQFPEGIHLEPLNPLAKPPKKNEKLYLRQNILLSPLGKTLTISLSFIGVGTE